MKIALTLLAFFFCSLTGMAQDTTIVQTFTFDSTGRSYDFNFPIDPNTSYEKIIMQYGMRCKNALISTGQSPNQGCGEWDYSCNTYVVDSTQTDSSKASRASHDISNFSGSVFGYTYSPTYTYYQYTQHQMTNTSTITETLAPVGSGSLGLTHPFSTTEPIAKTQYLWTETEMTTAGLIAGNITSIRLDVATPMDDANFMRVRMKHTSQTALDAANPELDNFTEVYFLNTQLVAGSNELIFYNPFNWDGVSNVLLEISYTNGNGGTSSTVNGHDAGFTGGLYASGQNAYYTFSGVGNIDVPATNLSTVTNEITVAFWQYGDENVMPANSTIFEGADAGNARQVNVHLPWGNSQVYWDCGNDGTGYDRINKPANPADFEGQWNHWAFTKNATTGDLKIYLNGALWHSGTGHIRPIDLQSLRIGASVTGGSQYFGHVDEFVVFDAELDATTIADWMNLPVTASHPFFSNLVAYFPMDEGSGTTTMDMSAGGVTGSINGPTQWGSIRGVDMLRNFSETTERPNVTFVQGTYTQTQTDIVVLDSVMNNQHSVISYQVVNNDLEIIDTIFVYQADTWVYTYDENGMVVDSLWITGTNSITITTLDYYNKYPMALELMSFVTPYGINLDLGPEGKMWEFDVTHFKNVLHGDRRIYLSRGGQNQEEMDIRFLFIEGTPPRDIIHLQQIWRVTKPGYGSIDNDDVFEPRDVMTDPSGMEFEIRSMITGHGQEGEFIQREHYLNVNGGVNERQWMVWTECADNPVYPQGGTWIYDRAGWCPGAATDEEILDITSSVTPGQTVNIDYGLVNSASGSSSYIVNHQLATYGAPNFTLDAKVEDILRPSSKILHGRLNPTCGKPKIRIRNTGSTSLSSLVINYGMKGQPTTTYNWTGSLAFNEIQDIELDEFPWGWWSGQGEFEVTISAPNGGADEYAQNNTLTSFVEITPMHDNEFIIWMRTNNAPTETMWWLKDIDGNVIASRTSGFSSGTHYRDTVMLTDGCYRLEVIDTDDDGISFWANSDGGGHIRVKGINQNYTTLNPDFGKLINYDFTVGGTLDMPEQPFNTLFEVYPNPNNGELSVEIDLKEQTQVQLQIVDVLGNIVFEENRPDFRSGTIRVELPDAADGLYFCNLVTVDGVQTKRFVINR